VTADSSFQCIVIAPTGKLLDCQSPSVVFPAHDGQVGVMRNHMPFFCKLGLGIMEVKPLPAGAQVPRSTFMLVDGGFAVVCENLLKVVSYDVIAPAEVKPETLEHIRAGITKKLHAPTLASSERLHLTRKLSLLAEVVELSGTGRKAE